MVNEREEMLAKSATLYFGPWYRQSPFFKSTLRAGCTAYDIYNHMYLPGYYDDPEVEYRLLNEGVTLWDVGVERTVQVAGPDADRLIDMITCRDLTTCAVKQGKYMLVTAPDGGIVNDPVLLHPEPNVWWMQLADSDAGLYATGVGAAAGLDAEVSYPDVHPVQVQGPLSARTLAKLVGEAIYDIKYYWCERFEIGGIPVLISRTGWTAIPGFEVNLLDGSRGDELWNAIIGAGEEFGIKPIAPCEARRIEAGIFNYNSDISIADTPFHVMGLERLVEEQPQDYLGKAALERIRREGVDRKLVGIQLQGDELRAELSEVWPVSHEGKIVGRVTDAIWSPGLEKNIGYVWVPIEHADPGTKLDVESENGSFIGTTAAIPFVDPRKEVPAASLSA
ncbi:MAG TPA: glycine cleavage T C-terminal barrel domain-containing protein [Actinomycetota bacterium]|nr:glycine cleavage T C-terminal barrel domain-containing protein [Actinomycetota bacterium]